MRRLSAAGFKLGVAREAVLPDWWEKECEADPSLLPELEFRIARFLEAPLATVRDPQVALAAPAYLDAQLRRVRDIHRDRLGPAIHMGLHVAKATIRCWSGSPPALRLPPTDPTVWRDEIPRAAQPVHLREVVSDLWERGIPVVHISIMPSPSFQGMVCIVEDRPVVVLAHDFDEPARLAFVIAHEAAHAVHGDCAPNQPVVDEEDVVDDAHEMEHRADLYSVRALAGPAPIPRLDEREVKALATRAVEIEKAHGVDAALVIRAWGKRTNEHSRATQAVQALYRMRGGKRVIREEFDRHIDLDEAAESDRALLRCLHGDPRRHETAG